MILRVALASTVCLAQMKRRSGSIDPQIVICEAGIGSFVDKSRAADVPSTRNFSFAETE